jgi:hypothetical protein
MNASVLRVVFLLTAAAWLAGCATTGPQTPEEVVKARANERWAAVLKGDVPKAYGYMAPGYRAVHGEQDYRNARGSAVKWVAAEAVEVRCPEATKCLAKVRIEAKPFMGRRFGDTIATHAEETWLLEDGQWWLFEKL